MHKKVKCYCIDFRRIVNGFAKIPREIFEKKREIWKRGEKFVKIAIIPLTFSRGGSIIKGEINL